MKRIALVLSLALAACSNPSPVANDNGMVNYDGNVMVNADECPRADKQPCK